MKLFLCAILISCGLLSNSQTLQLTDSASQATLPQGLNAVRFDALELGNKLQKTILDSVSQFKTILSSPFTNVYRSSAKLIGLQMNYSSLYDNAGYFDQPTSLGSFRLQSDWLFAGIPVEIGMQSTNSITTTTNFRVGFERDKLLNQLKSNLNRKLDPKALLASIPDPLAELKRSAEKSLRNELSQINSKYQNLLSKKIQACGDISNLFLQNPFKLRERLLTVDVLNSLHEQITLLEQLQTKLNLGEHIDTSQIHTLRENILELEGTRSLVEAIERHAQYWEASGLLANIKEWEKLKAFKLEQVLNNSAFVSQLVKQQLNLNSLQRLFLKINRLRLGVNSLSSSPLSVQNFLNNGAVGEFSNNGKTAILFMGKSMDGTSFLDMPYSSTLFSNAVGKGLQLGKSSRESGSNFSLISFDQGFNTLGNIADFVPFRHSLVTNFEKQFKIGLGRVNAEISRSVSTYNQSLDGTSQGIGVGKLFSLDNLASNTSFRVNYQSEIPAIKLNYQLHVKKVALGYENPGNPFLNNGSTEVGFSLRKPFKKALLLSVRSDIKDYNYNENSNQKWRNIYAVFDLKWKMRKGQFVSLRYLPNRMFRIAGQDKQVQMVFDQLSLDGNFNKKVGSSFYTNYLSFSYQKNVYGTALAAGTQSLNLISNQSFSIKKLLLYWNTSINHAVNKAQLFYSNSRFDSELGTSFGLFKTLSASTSVSYNAVEQWYSQVGFRQSISMNITKQFDLSMFLDAQKNLKLYQPLIFGLLRGEIAAHYTIR